MAGTASCGMRVNDTTGTDLRCKPARSFIWWRSRYEIHDHHMQGFEVGERIDEKVDLVPSVAVTPHGSAKQGT